ncbi:MAG TPA: tyrosine-type recombinase/integrase [Micromonosporaceae bacterium]|nr:tyrosine-type recombinase/integrase [Micromonosporaceae bacterium]
MTEGSVWKRCTCKDPETGHRLNGQCPKLRRPTGGWNSTHGTWGYQLELPPLGTRRRQLRRGGFASRDAAVDERDHARGLLDLAGGDHALAVEIGTLLHGCKPGTPLPDRDTVARRIRAGVRATTSVTVAEYLTGWLAGRRGLAEKTVRGYADHIHKYLVPHLGKIGLQDLRTHHIEATFTAINVRNTEIETARASKNPDVRATVKGVRTVGAASQQRLRATLRKALNDAIHKAKLIDTNPAVGVELASGKRPKARVWTDKAVARWKATGKRPSPVMVWTPAHAGAFLDYAEAHDIVLYAMFVLILHRGLRRGEAVGLRDDDVDLDSGHATIVEQITTVGYRPITTTVKSDAGDRIIPLGPATITVLRAYMAMRAGWQQVSGDDWPDTGLFFVQPDGRAWHPQTVSNRFGQLIADSGLPPVRLHDLRHCAATYLRHGGADMKEVQETLGHATLGITSDTYTSVILELQRANADAAADLIPRTKPKAA